MNKRKNRRGTKRLLGKIARASAALDFLEKGEGSLFEKKRHAQVVIEFGQSPQVVNLVRNSFIRDNYPPLSRRQLDRSLDIITSKGTVPECVSVLHSIPNDGEHQITRSLLLRRIWQTQKSRMFSEPWFRQVMREAELSFEEKRAMAMHYNDPKAVEVMFANAKTRRPHAVHASGASIH